MFFVEQLRKPYPSRALQLQDQVVLVLLALALEMVEEADRKVLVVRKAVHSKCHQFLDGSGYFSLV